MHKVEELTRSLESKISGLEEQSRSSNEELLRSVDSMFESDDKLLRSLEKLSNEFDISGSKDDSGPVEKLQETCMK